MSCGKIIDNVKYIHLLNNNELKLKSLNDCVYFTLRDIFENAYNYDTILEVNWFCEKLTGELYFEDRKSTYTYTDALNKPLYLKKLITWLNKIDMNYFEFILIGEDDQINIEEYIKFDEWWFQFEQIKILIKQHYEKCCMSIEDTI
jgi:hypothetical protein